VEGFVRDRGRLCSDGLGQSGDTWDIGIGDSPSFGDLHVNRQSRHHYTEDGMGGGPGLFD